jgi:hypothetical protein
LSQVYREIFEDILGEEVRGPTSNLALAEGALAIAERNHRPMLFLLHDGSEHSAAFEQWLALAARYRMDDRSFFPLVSRYVVVVLPLEEMPALSRRLQQPPFEVPNSARPLLVVTRSDGRQLAASTGWNSARQLTCALAAGLVDNYQRQPPSLAEMRYVTRIVDRVDRSLAESLREMSRQRFAAAR